MNHCNHALPPGHAEAVDIQFDPNTVSYEELLDGLNTDPNAALKPNHNLKLTPVLVDVTPKWEELVLSVTMLSLLNLTLTYAYV